MSAALARLRALDKKLTPEQRREVAKEAARRLLKLEAEGSEKAKRVLDKARKIRDAKEKAGETG